MINKNLTSIPLTPEDQKDKDMEIPATSDASNSAEANNMEVGLPNSDPDPRGLRFAPPEVREMIFTHMFKDLGTSTYYQGMTEFPILYSELPAILQALHSERDLFHEALAVYSKVHRFYTFWGTEKKGDVSATACKLIQDLRIEHDKQTWDHGWNENHSDYHERPEHEISRTMLRILRRATNIQQLRLIFEANDDDSFKDEAWDLDNDEVLDRAVYSIRSIPKLKKLSIRYYIGIDVLGNSMSTPGCVPYGELFGSISDGLFNFTGSFEAQLYDPWSSAVCVLWKSVWRAKPGRVLEWRGEPEESEYPSVWEPEDGEVDSDEDLSDHFPDKENVSDNEVVSVECGIPLITKDVSKRGNWRYHWQGKGCKLHSHDLNEYLQNGSHTDEPPAIESKDDPKTKAE